MRCRLVEGLRFGTPINSKLQFQFVQFSPRGRLRFLLAGGFTRLADVGFLQSAAIRLAQRMLRKLKENIFPHKRRQVHAIVLHGHLFLASPSGKCSVQSDQIPARIQRLSGSGRTRIPTSAAASPAPARRHPAFLNLQVVMQRLLGADQLVAQVQIQFRQRQFALQIQIACSPDGED